jgi:hypothetical protein
MAGRPAGHGEPGLTPSPARSRLLLAHEPVPRLIERTNQPSITPPGYRGAPPRRRRRAEPVLPPSRARRPADWRRSRPRRSRRRSRAATGRPVRAVPASRQPGGPALARRTRHQQLRGEPSAGRIGDDGRVVKPQPPASQREPCLVDGFLGAEEEPVPAHLRRRAHALGQPGALGGGGHHVQHAAGQREARLCIDAERGNRAARGNGAGPVTGAVRDAARHPGRPARFARRPGQDRRAGQAEPGKRGAGSRRPRKAGAWPYWRP